MRELTRQLFAVYFKFCFQALYLIVVILLYVIYTIVIFLCDMFVNKLLSYLILSVDFAEKYVILVKI